MSTFVTPLCRSVRTELDAARPNTRGPWLQFRAAVRDHLVREAAGQVWRLVIALATMALAAGCSTAPTNLDTALAKESSAGIYRVALEPPPQPPAINQMHSWKVKLTTPAGTPVQGARMGVAGGMPQHGHGFPTQPRVTRETEDGTYLLEGMKFSMTGWWEVKLAIHGPQGDDKVTFNTIVARP